MKSSQYFDQVSKKKQDTIDLVVEMRCIGKGMVEEKRREMAGWDDPGDTPDTDMLAWLIRGSDFKLFFGTIIFPFTVPVKLLQDLYPLVQM